MKVLVTGSSGFIGSNLCRRLVEDGYTVRAFHRATSNLRMLEGLPVEHAIGDLTQPETVRAAVEGVEAVFHLAAWVGMNEPGRLYAITVEGTRAVVQAALQAGVRRLVYTSSVAALGVPQPGNTALMDERATWNFAPELLPYGYAKYLAELEIQKGAAQGLDCVIVNPPLVIGPGDLYRQTTSFIMQIANRKVGLAVEGGTNVVHVADVARGQIAALQRGRSGERYILGGENLTYLEIEQRIARIAEVPAPSVVLPGSVVRGLRGLASLVNHFFELPVTPDVFILAGRYLYYDTCKARTELNLQEPIGIDQAISDTIAWYQNGSPSA
jgi:dihydroflavonol-4-reductase